MIRITHPNPLELPEPPWIVPYTMRITNPSQLRQIATKPGVHGAKNLKIDMTQTPPADQSDMNIRADDLGTLLLKSPSLRILGLRSCVIVGDFSPFVKGLLSCKKLMLVSFFGKFCKSSAQLAALGKALASLPSLTYLYLDCWGHHSFDIVFPALRNPKCR